MRAWVKVTAAVCPLSSGQVKTKIEQTTVGCKLCVCCCVMSAHRAAVCLSQESQDTLAKRNFESQEFSFLLSKG